MLRKLQKNLPSSLGIRYFLTIYIFSERVYKNMIAGCFRFGSWSNKKQKRRMSIYINGQKVEI